MIEGLGTRLAEEHEKRGRPDEVGSSLVPSPPPQLSSLAVRITRRRPGHVMYAAVTSHILVVKFCGLVPRRTISWERDWNYYATVATISIDSVQTETNM